MMGYSPDALEVAIEVVGDQDPSAVMDWIAQNQHRIHEIQVNKAIEMTR